MILDNLFERMVLAPKRPWGGDPQIENSCLYKEIPETVFFLQPQEVQQKGNIYDQDMVWGCYQA